MELQEATKLAMRTRISISMERRLDLWDRHYITKYIYMIEYAITCIHLMLQFNASH